MNGSGERDFSPRLLRVWRKPPSPLPRALMGTVALLFTALLVWAWFGQLDVVARAQGSLVPETRLKIVQPFEGGRVQEILVREGQLVEAGQTLMRMDTHLSNIDTATLRKQAELARLNLRRIATELAGESFDRREGDTPELYATVRSRYRTNRRAHADALETAKAALSKAKSERRAALQVQGKLEELLPIYRQQEAAYERLGESGNVASEQIMDKRRQRIEAERALEEQQQKLAELKGEITQTRARIDQLTSEYQQQLMTERGRLQNELTQLEAKLEKQAYRSGLQELTAPQSGIVKDLATHTEGYVVPSGTELMTLVPADEPLQAEVYVSNQDIGFIRKDQTARVKLAPYPFQRFGTVQGKVTIVSPDAQDARQQSPQQQQGQPPGAYKAVLSLDKQHLAHEGERYELRPGMTVIAEINLGRRTVLEYLVSPVRQTLDYAGKER